MSLLAEFESYLEAGLRNQFLQLNTPFAIQEYLDSMPYIGEERDRSPLQVMLDSSVTVWTVVSWQHSFCGGSGSGRS